MVERKSLKLTYLNITIQNGRDRRTISVANDGHARTLRSIKFNEYVALGSFRAFASYSKGTIEAAILTVLDTGTRASTLEALRNIPGFEADNPVDSIDGESEEGEDDEKWRLPIESKNSWKIEVSPGSREAIALISQGVRRVYTIPVTLKISGLHISEHDEALEILETLSGALFFNFELRYNIVTMLRRVPSAKYQSLFLSDYDDDTRKPHLPRFKYAEKPLSLYWYARTSSEMPLLQYLAFYQVLEFYFLHFSQNEVVQRLRQELQHPRFDPSSDSNIAKVISLVNGHGRGAISERDQLKATIRGCVDQESIKTFLELDEEYFKESRKISGVRPIRFDGKGEELRDQVADRVYDIRCRIVHTKDSKDPKSELLLPFSAEVKWLGREVDLVRYLAQRVLIAGSVPMQI
ncbi:hypothetical protein [Frankia gtarii]|uniref:hypothetical protein n=1 Tax=Frankia gtarii TaxID=2950102 RepID=UPI0021C01722|nr:hypothetical protein [Frankia gtarii]